MKHLFVINPTVDKLRDRVGAAIEDIESCFMSNPQLRHDIHVTRWSRDAEGFIRRYVTAATEMIRVHVFGGSGTLFEAVNGVIGLPNVQLAAYPMGRSNYFLRYFGGDKMHLFASLRNQIYSGVTAIDAIRCSNIFGISHGLVGIDAESGRDGEEMNEKMRLPTDICYLWAVTKRLLTRKNLGAHYEIKLDGIDLDGDYASMMIANTPCYGRYMVPAPGAHPNDGKFEVLLVKNTPQIRRLSTLKKYAFGQHEKIADRVLHYSGSKIQISSESVICMSVDGETFYDTRVDYELIPYAIDFVCPAGIDPSKLPRFHNRPEEGYVGE